MTQRVFQPTTVLLRDRFWCHSRKEVLSAIGSLLVSESVRRSSQCNRIFTGVRVGKTFFSVQSDRFWCQSRIDFSLSLFLFLFCSQVGLFTDVRKPFLCSQVFRVRKTYFSQMLTGVRNDCTRYFVTQHWVNLEFQLRNAS